MTYLIRALRFFDRLLTWIETAGVTVGLVVMVVLYFIQVVGRNTRLGAVAEFQTIAQHLVLWVGMLGASLAVADRKHISIELISNLVTAQGRRVVEGIVDLATVVMCLLLAWVSWGYIDFLE